jgi:hypothetical protein
MTPSLGASQIISLRTALEDYSQQFARRAANHKNDFTLAEEQRLQDAVRARCVSLLDDWLNIAEEFQYTNVKLKYQKWESGAGQRLLYDFLDSELQQLPLVRRRFRANRSMRDVEPNVDVTIKNLNDWGER